MPAIPCQADQTFDEGVSVLLAERRKGRLCCQQTGFFNVQKKLKEGIPCVLIFDPGCRLMNQHQVRLGQVRSVQLAIEDSLDDAAQLAFLSSLASESAFNRIP